MARNGVPISLSFRIVGDAARHSLQAEEVLREEQHVHADEENPEMKLAKELGQLAARHFAKPVGEPCKESKNGTQ